jgi:hypothetical protein
MGNVLEEASISAPLVETTALWTWDLSGVASGSGPKVIGYGYDATPTKTGLSADDLLGFVGIPLQVYGNPPTPIPATTIIQWLRYAEDWVEQRTNLLLTPTWVAAPPSLQSMSTRATGLITDNSTTQQEGIDYDLADSPYDFFFPRAQDEGWMYQSLRYRPVRNPNAFPDSNTQKIFSKYYTSIHNVAYIYPLLNDFFRVPPTWFVEDTDFGLVRLVPAANVQMLPLFAMQLAFMGFAESIPGGLWFQYTAGLNRSDYNGRFSFIKQLVLAQATVQALTTMQLSINYGATSTEMNVDGMQYKTQYNKDGAFAGQIAMFTKIRDELLAEAINKVSGPMLIAL